MSYRPNMTAFTEGIRPLAPLRWRALDGAMVDLWHAEGQEGGGGQYLSPDPRIVIFLDDGAEAVRLTGDQTPRAKAAICYIPAGMPLRSRITETRAFRHLDLHFAAPALQRRMTQLARGRLSAQALAAPVMLESDAGIQSIAALLSEDLAGPGQPALYAEGLIQAILGALFARAAEPCGKHCLTAAQLRRLEAHLRANLHRRVPAEELATAIGLSESWFAHAFKQATAETPYRWQMRLRIDQAKRLLRQPAQSIAGVADATGFADQAHLTRAFRQLTGATPAAWRREQKA